ncbi:MAG: acyl-CoA dehydrogenase family protein [Acidimicrobiales bacterium]
MIEYSPADAELGLSDAERTVIEAAAAFAREVVEPAAAGWERDRRLPREAFAAAAASGLAGLAAPAELGGAALGSVAKARVMEELARADLAFTFVLVVHNNLVAALCRHGRAEQQRRYVPALARGELLGAFLLTEPGAGSDAAAITTTAEAAGSGWRLSGEKAWVTNAASADLLQVYARAEGIGSFLVRADQPGVRRTEPYHLLGCHAMGAGGVVLDRVEVDPEHVLIPPGQALRAALAGIDGARVEVAAMCSGVLARALGEAVAYTKARPAFGGAVAQFQGVQWMLADVATELAAARLLAYDAARALAAGSPGAPAAAAHAKKFATRSALTGVAACMQVMGAEGLRHEHPLARALAAAKTAQYLDGATEIQNVVLSRALFA